MTDDGRQYHFAGRSRQTAHAASGYPAAVITSEFHPEKRRCWRQVETPLI
jgi:hypothetical protein